MAVDDPADRSGQNCVTEGLEEFESHILGPSRAPVRARGTRRPQRTLRRISGERIVGIGWPARRRARTSSPKVRTTIAGQAFVASPLADLTGREGVKRI